MDADRLREEIIRLGPWHHDIDVTPEVSTRVSEGVDYPATLGQVKMLDLRDQFMRKLGRIYPNGLEGRTVLDCGCNCGEHLFWSKEMGAGQCFGFDVREHWINQARFLQENRTKPSDGLRFEVADLYSLPEFDLEPLDIVLFHGIFYHLPDPVHGLQLAADLTKELMIFTTSTRTDLKDGLLWLKTEPTERLLMGMHEISWRPTGPQVVERLLRYVGFPETYLMRHRKVQGSETRGRLEMLASKAPGLLTALSEARAGLTKTRI
jgi:tRNA (mo5U34)-methyltransferase